MKEIEQILCIFPFASIYSGARRVQMRAQYEKAHFWLSLDALLNLSVCTGIIFSVFAFFCALILFADAIFAFGIFLIVFSICLLAIFRLPLFLAKRYARKCESDLPSALRSISLHLRIKMPFEAALEHAARAGYSSSAPFSDALMSIKSGASVPSSLAKMALSIDSISFAKTAHALALVYERGYAPDTLESLANELIAMQEAEIKMQSSRLAMLSLVYLAISSLLPAFFLIMAVSAGPILGIGADPFMIWIFYLLALPCANLIVFGAMVASSPSMLSGYEQKNIDELARTEAKKYGVGLSPIFLTGASAALAAAGLLLGFAFAPAQTILFALAFASFPFLFYAYMQGKVVAKISLLESELSGMLLAGALEQKFSLEKMLEAAAKSSSPELCTQAGAALGQIKAGADPNLVLLKWAKQTPSLMLSRSLSLLMIGYKTGSNLQNALRCASQELMASFALARERAALLAVQNYTILASSALLVPAVLAISANFSSQILQISNVASSDFAAGFFDASKIGPSVSAAEMVIPIYLALNAFMAAFFVSAMQGARQRFVIYAMLIALLAQTVWLLVGLA
ncbi:MAG: type II secretion system F family protein [Candidatus Micrarchaeia archaeon]